MRQLKTSVQRCRMPVAGSQRQASAGLHWWQPLAQEPAWHVAPLGQSPSSTQPTQRPCGEQTGALGSQQEQSPGHDAQSSSPGAQTPSPQSRPHWPSTHVPSAQAVVSTRVAEVQAPPAQPRSAQSRRTERPSTLQRGALAQPLVPHDWTTETAAPHESKR
jgi:hypothetical protein